mmetsp:Transcript_2667/g.8025  ORF Transcript_2667/g.8025 Transcript_2667/m.8025 type:complete len:140 (+) Transcript_2667:107-526(+)
MKKREEAHHHHAPQRRRRRLQGRGNYVRAKKKKKKKKEEEEEGDNQPSSTREKRRTRKAPPCLSRTKATNRDQRGSWEPPPLRGSVSWEWPPSVVRTLAAPLFKTTLPPWSEEDEDWPMVEGGGATPYLSPVVWGCLPR